MRKMRILPLLLSLGIILMNIIPGSAVIGEVYGHSEMKNVGAGGSSSSSNTNASQYLQGVANRAMIILGIIAGALVAALWIFRVAIPYFSSDSQKKAQAKENMLDAAIATIIIVMAAVAMIYYFKKRGGRR